MHSRHLDGAVLESERFKSAASAKVNLSLDSLPDFTSMPGNAPTRLAIRSALLDY